MKFIYSKAKQKMLGAAGSPAAGQEQLNLITDTIKMVLIDTSAYTPSASHEFLSEVASGARIGTPQTLSGKAVTNGAFSATSPVTFTAVPRITSNGEAEGILIYKDTGTEATSTLIEFCNESPDASLPVLPNGGSIQITLPSPIFSL